MKLRDWRKSKGLSLRAMSEKLGKSKSQLARLETGDSDPDSAFLKQVFVVTDGVVTPNDFVDLPAVAAAPEQGRAA